MAEQDPVQKVKPYDGVFDRNFASSFMAAPGLCEPPSPQVCLKGAERERNEDEEDGEGEVLLEELG